MTVMYQDVRSKLDIVKYKYNIHSMHLNVNNAISQFNY